MSEIVYLTADSSAGEVHEIVLTVLDQMSAWLSFAGHRGIGDASADHVKYHFETGIMR